MTVKGAIQLSDKHGELNTLDIFRLTVRRLGGIGILAFIVLATFSAAAVFAPWVSPYDPNAPDLMAMLTGPSFAHPLGTDGMGRDILSRIIWGARITLLGPTLVILISTLIGTTLALLAAWKGGVIDTIISWALDVLFSVPALVFGLIAVAVFDTNLLVMVFGLSIGYIPYVARVVRGASLRERQLSYVLAAWLQGQSGTGIAIKQILPNVQPIIVAQAVSSLGFAVVELAAISFLGLGVQPPTPALGVMLKNGFDAVLRGHPIEAICSSIAIVLIIWSITVLGDQLTSRIKSAL